jgi:hypothetical protein
MTYLSFLTDVTILLQPILTEINNLELVWLAINGYPVSFGIPLQKTKISLSYSFFTWGYLKKQKWDII